MVSVQLKAGWSFLFTLHALPKISFCKKYISGVLVTKGLSALEHFLIQIGCGSPEAGYNLDQSCPHYQDCQKHTNLNQHLCTALTHTQNAL